MNKKDLIANIVHNLYRNDLLNEIDCTEYEVLCSAVGDIIEHELADYIIISGNILD